MLEGALMRVSDEEVNRVLQSMPKSDRVAALALAILEDQADDPIAASLGTCALLVALTRNLNYFQRKIVAIEMKLQADALKGVALSESFLVH
jgi:hypothetical protein